MDPSELWESLSWQLVAVCALSFVLGGIGGLMHLAGTGETPPPPPATGAPAGTAAPPVRLWIVGIRRFLVGGVAAVAILYITDPKTGIALIGGSIAAGYAGQAVLAGLEARVKAAVAVKDAAETRADLRQLVVDHDTLVEGARGGAKVDDTRVVVAAARIADLKAKYTLGGGR